jgi:hypothetical protein
VWKPGKIFHRIAIGEGAANGGKPGHVAKKPREPGSSAGSRQRGIPLILSTHLRRGQLRITRDEAGVDGKVGQGCDSADAQLFHEPLAMFFDGFDADAQFRGGLFAEFAFGDKLQHRTFAGGQLLNLLPGREVSIIRPGIFGKTRNGSLPAAKRLEIATTMDSMSFHIDAFPFVSSVWLSNNS